MTTAAQKTSSNDLLTESKTSSIHWSVPFLGLVVFWLVQIFLRHTLDLRDYPGAAGTLSLYRATGRDAGTDIAAYGLRWLQYWLNVDLHAANTILSVGSGSAIVLSSTVIAWRVLGREAALWSGLFAALWTPHPFMAILTGIDPMVLGGTALALALISVGLFSSWMGTPLVVVGTALLLPLLQAKSIAIPLCAIGGIWLFPPKKWKPWLLSGILLISSVLFFQPSADGRFTIPAFTRRTLEFGWIRIHQLYERGFPEGKFDQIWILGGMVILLSAILQRNWTRNTSRLTILWLLTGFVMFFTAASLGQVLRPRYLAGFGVALIIPIGWGISLLSTRRQFLFGTILSIVFTLDTWAFFHQWGHLRHQILGGNPPHIWTPPSYWTQQYSQYPVLTLKDLTMTGALDFQDAWLSQPETQGIALPRLRDERHRNIQAYAAMRGQDILILDPGKCCAGHPVDDLCAAQTAQQVLDSGYALLLPTEIPDVDRIYPNEHAWIEDLASHVASNGVHSDFWVWQPSNNTASTSNLPCQFDVPFKKKQ